MIGGLREIDHALCLPRTVRWVAKGTMITMDYSGDRLTVYLDAAGRIERTNCG